MVMDTKLVNPLNELKRRFEDDSITITKRLCLAKNVFSTSYFATTPKEIIVGDWISSIVKENKVSREEIRNYLSWLPTAEKLTQDFKSRIIEVLAYYVKVNDLEPEDIISITSLIATDSISKELHNHIQEFLIISKHLLLYFKNENNTAKSIEILNYYIKYYKECKKKIEFTEKFTTSDNLEIIFDCLDTSELEATAYKVCQEILFSDVKKSSYALYFKALIRQENVDKLLEETSLTLQSVLKIMDVIFKFPTGRNSSDPIFLQKFIDTFVKCYQKEHQLVFAFYIICVNILNMEQNYLIPNTKLCIIEFDKNEEKIRRKIFLKMMETLLSNDIDISIRLTDTLGEKISKVEHKKNFTVFLETVMLNQLKLEGKPDKITFQIVITAMKLDPLLIEKKMPNILPHLMISKKGNNMNVYEEMLNCLLETLFKLSRGNLFFNKMLPHLKLKLEAYNTDQCHLKIKFKDLGDEGETYDKISSKIIKAHDVFPEECAQKFGLLSSELMFRQCGELLLSLQKDFEEHCLMMLEERYISPSVIIIAEILSNVFYNFFQNCKLADHTVPAHISEDFWSIFQKFECDILQKFGECLFKLSFDSQLTQAFLKICIGYTHLKILNVQYSNHKRNKKLAEDAEEVFDLSMLLPCLTCKQWNKLRNCNSNNESTLSLFNNLLVLKIIYYKINNFNYELTETKSHLLDEIEKKNEIFNSTIYFPEILLNNLNTHQLKQFTKILLHICFEQPESNILQQEYIINNEGICYSFSMEIIKTLLKLIEKKQTPPSLSKAIKKSDFAIKDFIAEINITDYFNQLTNDFDDTQIDTMLRCIEFLKDIRVFNTNENCILTTVFVLLAIKSVISKKKHRKCIDSLLQTIFELSNKHPDVFKLFPLEFMFAFPDNKFSNLVTLNVKTSNRLMIMKIILEIAVKKVKTDSSIVKNIVEILLLNQKSKDGSSIEYFSNEVFQISCLILPLIAKEKKAINTSAYRSILAELQEKLHKSLLKCFKNIDFATEKSLFLNNTGNPEESVISENTVATLNAIDAFSLTLSKYCEANNAEAIQNLDALWSGLGFFVDHAIVTLHNTDSKLQHVQASIQLMNTVLRYIKKLDSHEIFLDKDNLFLRIWKSVLARLMIIFRGKKHQNTNCLEELEVTMKFFCELSSVHCFVTNFVADLAHLTILKKPSKILKEYDPKSCQLIPHRVALYLWKHSLKSNIIVPKCAALSKCMQSYCKNLITWLTKHFDPDMKKLILEEMHDNSVYYVEINNDKVDYQDDIIDEDNVEADANDNIENDLGDINDHFEDEDEIEHKKMNKKVLDYKISIDHPVCEVLVTDLNMLSEVILAAKRISLDYKFIDLIFEIQNIVFPILDFEDISWPSVYIIIDACISILNSFLVSREELLEDRWPLFNVCYRKLVWYLCRKSSTQYDLDRDVVERLAELAHSIEKLTQSFCKRKQQVSRLASYLVGDLCSWLEEMSPARGVRQHLETCVMLLVQASDSSYTPGFLKRAMEHIPGQRTMVNMYSMYKRYHKYVGNA